MPNQTSQDSRQLSLASDDLAGDVQVAAWDAHRRGQITQLADAHGPIAAIVPAHAELRPAQPVLIRVGTSDPGGKPLVWLGWFIGSHSPGQNGADPDMDVWVGDPITAPGAGQVYTFRRSQLTGLYQEGA